jgi:hypothetical protein
LLLYWGFISCILFSIRITRRFSSDIVDGGIDIFICPPIMYNKRRPFWSAVSYIAGNISFFFLPTKQEKNAYYRAVNLLTVLMIHEQIQCSHIEFPLFFLYQKIDLDVPWEWLSFIFCLNKKNKRTQYGTISTWTIWKSIRSFLKRNICNQ